MPRWVVPAAVLLLSGCVGEGQLTPDGTHLCKSMPLREVASGGTYAWINGTVVDFAAQGWGAASFRIVPCRTVGANFAVVALPGGTNQNPAMEPYPYVVVLVYPEDGVPATLSDAVTGTLFHAYTFVRWSTPQAVPAPANDWSMVLQAQTPYRVVVATNVEGYRLQIRDENPTKVTPAAWTTNLTLDHRGPLARMVAPEVVHEVPAGALVERTHRTWNAHYDPPADAMLLVRSWFDATGHKGNYTDRFLVRIQTPEGPADHAKPRDRTLTGLESATHLDEFSFGLVRSDSVVEVRRTLHVTSVAPTPVSAGVATMIVPLSFDTVRAA